MDDIFSIGETAKINDISIKALRHYDEMGLLKPRYIDPQNGYRYYTYDQFSFIDKIKRFKNLGMPLKELKALFETQNLKLIEEFLKKERLAILEEEKRLEEKKQNIKWLSEFFNYSKALETTQDIYQKQIGPRHMIAAPCDGSDSMYDMDMELRRVILFPEFKEVQILNPYGYILDFGELMKNRFYPTASTVSIHPAPKLPSPYYMEVPAGKYLCCQAKILSEKLDVTPLIQYCHDHNLTFDFVIACEYLKSLYDPSNSPYEIQALIKKPKE